MGHLRRGGAALAVALNLAVAGGPVAAATGPGAADAVQVTLAPKGSTSVRQGLPFAVGVVATNPGAQRVRATVATFVGPASGGTSVAFATWTVDLAPQEAARVVQRVTTAQWFAALGGFEVTATVDGVASGPALPFTVTHPPVEPPRFRDVTRASGITTVLPGHPCSRHAAGAAWGDADGDGALDLYVPVQDGPAQLWMNDGAGRFTDEASTRGVDNGGAIGIGAVFVDVTGDEFLDLSVVNDGPNRLYVNDGTGHFADQAAALGVADGGNSSSAAWGDYDGDGRLDLFVTNYLRCNVLGVAHLYHQEQDGRFTDQTELLRRTGSTTGAAFQGAWLDYDRDGRPDLYQANDYLPEQSQYSNVLWHNEGPDGGGWRFTNVSSDSGTGYSMHSMGIGIGDPDHDGALDLAISDIAGNVLAHNNGDGTFTDVAGVSNMRRPLVTASNPSVTWGLDFADLNLDGWEDLYVAASETTLPVGQPNQLFAGVGSGRFADLSATGGAADRGVSRGVAFADFDRDGRVDLFVLNQFGRPRLYRNVTPFSGRHWLEVSLRGLAPNTDACGAVLTLHVGGDRQTQQMSCGSTSFASGSDRVAHFGLGSVADPSELDITWPSGATEVVSEPGSDHLITVVQTG